MTRRQYEFIGQLTDELGFKGSPARVRFLESFTARGADVEAASALIERLLALKVVREEPRTAAAATGAVRVTDLAEYVYCPASYAIRATWEVPATEPMAEGAELHESPRALTFLKNLEAKWAREGVSLSHRRGPHADLIRSRLVFRGHGDDVRPVWSPKRTLVGVPDYVFKRPDGSRVVVEEKHTWRVPDRPWPSHLVQALAYVRGLPRLGADSAYVLYFPWSYYRGNRRLGSPRLHPVPTGAKEVRWLVKVFRSVDTLREGGSVPFDTSRLNGSKCARCPCMPLCHHKSGTRADLETPYPR